MGTSYVAHMTNFATKFTMSSMIRVVKHDYKPFGHHRETDLITSAEKKWNLMNAMEIK